MPRVVAAEDRTKGTLPGIEFVFPFGALAPPNGRHPPGRRLRLPRSRASPSRPVLARAIGRETRSARRGSVAVSTPVFEDSPRYVTMGRFDAFRSG